MNALGQEDPLGLRERLLIVYQSSPASGSMLGHGGEPGIAAERVGDEGRAEIVE